jgi:NADH-quinone oxidoreductase subunit E
MNEFSNDIVTENLIDNIISRQKEKPGNLLSALEEIQELHHLKYLPEQTLKLIARKMEVPYSQVYGVVTFYSFFNLKPQGKNCITVCRGTACHTKGSKALLDDVFQIIGVKNGSAESENSYTTDDNLFTIKTVACFGQCALSPVISVNGIIHSNVNTQKLIKILNKIKK